MSRDLAAEAAAALPVTVLTGFLGSGKTTLLAELLRHPGLSDTAVLINEFGSVGLDHHLVRQSSEDVVLLNSGCLCCTVRGDLVTALRDLFLKRVRGDVPEFRRVVIETTGLADPAPILHTLMTDPLIGARYRLDGIVTTVDAVHAMAQLDTQPEPVKQVAVADRLVLTKTDLTPPDTLAGLEDRLRALNPAAPILRADHGRLDPAAILDCGLFRPESKIPDVAAWLRSEAYHDDSGHGHGHGHEHGHGHHHHHHDVDRHDAHVAAFALVYDEPLQWSRLATALDMLAAMKGEALLRVKGIVHAADFKLPVAVHGVQHVFHPPVELPAWPDGDRSSRLVFITRDLDRAFVTGILDAALGLTAHAP